MVEMAIKDINGCLISRIEEELPTPNYSYKTIDYVIDYLGYSDVYFCLGSIVLGVLRLGRIMKKYSIGLCY